MFKLVNLSVKILLIKNSVTVVCSGILYKFKLCIVLKNREGIKIIFLIFNLFSWCHHSTSILKLTNLK